MYAIIRDVDMQLSKTACMLGILMWWWVAKQKTSVERQAISTYGTINIQWRKQDIQAIHACLFRSHN